MSFFELNDETEDSLKSLDDLNNSLNPKKSKYPFAEMKVMQSFVFDDDVKIHSMRCLCSRWSTELGIKLKVYPKARKVVRIA